jgi:hypothetical protein
MFTNTFSMSGNLGDLIYSLAVVKKLGGGTFYVKLNNIPNVIREYNNGPVPPEYENKLSDVDFDLLKPLLVHQKYIMSVEKFNKNIHLALVNLDEFRGVIHRSVRGNFLKAFYTTHKIPFTDADLIQPWLTVDNPKRVAKFVIARSPRWRGKSPHAENVWKELIEKNDISRQGVFVGLPAEHQDFEKTFNLSIPYHPCKDFLELAEVIAGGDAFLGNQTFTYGIAQGLGKPTVLETFSARTNLLENECFFARSDCFYF